VSWTDTTSHCSVPLSLPRRQLTPRTTALSLSNRHSYNFWVSRLAFLILFEHTIYTLKLVVEAVVADVSPRTARVNAYVALLLHPSLTSVGSIFILFCWTLDYRKCRVRARPCCDVNKQTKDTIIIKKTKLLGPVLAVYSHDPSVTDIIFLVPTPCSYHHSIPHVTDIIFLVPTPCSYHHSIPSVTDIIFLLPTPCSYHHSVSVRVARNEETKRKKHRRSLKRSLKKSTSPTGSERTLCLFVCLFVRLFVVCLVFIVLMGGGGGLARLF
jgi:hypothetical protein